MIWREVLDAWMAFADLSEDDSRVTLGGGSSIHSEKQIVARRTEEPGTRRADVGYRSLAFDLELLVQSLRGCPTSSIGLTAARAPELHRAEELAATILNLLGRRKKLRAGIEAAADLRKRAFTLFARVYEETRRVVVFLRWYEGDAEKLVPLLRAKRNVRKNKNKEPKASNLGPRSSDGT